MRTISYLSAAKRSLPYLLGPYLVFAFAPFAHAASPHDPPALASAAAPASYGLGQQDHPSAQNVSLTSSANITEQMNIYSVGPETLGDLLMIHQHYLAAIEAYQRAPRDSAIVWNKLGIAYQHMYALDIAKLQYEKALSMNPKYAEALNNLGTVYYGERNYRKAEKYYRKAIHIKKDNASFYSNLGTAYFAEHKYKRGLEDYRLAFSIDPNVFIGDSIARVEELGPRDEQITLNYDLAQLYAQAGMVNAAIHYLRLAFIAGFNDPKKLMHDQSFIKLRQTSQFRLLLTEEHINKPNSTEESYVVPAGETLR